MKLKIPQKFISIAHKIAQTAQENDFESYIVGGFVRDLLLKKEPKDIDIMVAPKKEKNESAGIALSKLIAKKYNFSDPVIFERFGTAKLNIDGEEIEFVMPRKEYYQDNSRNPDTDLGSLEQDALRRDFTVNALFLRLTDMKVLDLTKKGIKDIKRKVLQVTDSKSAELIFNQDPLRILRAIRLSRQLGFTIERKSLSAMKKTVSRIKIVSPERVRDEIVKILIQDKPSKSFIMMDKIGLLDLIFPEIKRLQGLKQPAKYHNNDVYTHTLKVLDRTENLLTIRMAALLHDTGKFETSAKPSKDKSDKITFYGHEMISKNLCEVILNRLKFSKDFIDQVANIVKNHMRPINYDSTWSDSAIRRLAFDCGDDLEFVLALAKADYGKTKPSPKIAELIKRAEILQLNNSLKVEKNFLSGDSLMKYFNLPQGEWIKEAKNKINEALIENPALNKDRALEMIKEFLKSKKII